MKNMLTDTETAALAAVAIQCGRTWKQELRFMWEDGKYPSWADSCTLQQLRNSQSFGPMGLIRYKAGK